MTEAEYIEQRLDDQIIWYDRKSQWNQLWYKRLRVVEIVCACSIPFVLSFTADGKGVMVGLAGLFGVVVAVVSGVISLFKFEENWVSYRATCEKLQHEKLLHATGTSPYDGENNLPLLVQRVEAIISREGLEWQQHVVAKEEGGGSA
ncbi:MAG TPA: DUF4231 domain-containing protein [Sedimenticola sp.]|nr:DUF4231 domain-containing protein [Sedimenticola sp.]